MDDIKYKIGSMFDGSGGFPLAGSLCGIEPTWASEVEPYPIAVTRTRFPNMKHLGDISKIDGGAVEPVDVITFGSPCQDLSVAGKQAGIKHTTNGDEETTRSGLFMEAVRIIKEMRRKTDGNYPSFALWENVPGAFSSNKGEDFRIVLEELIKIVEPSASMPEVPKNGWPYADSYVGDGWSLAYRVFDAQYWGVPQRRRRIHLVLDLRGERARDVLFEREGLRGYFAPSEDSRQGAASDAQGSLGADDREGESARDGRGRLDDIGGTYIIDNIGGQAEYGKASPVNGTLRAGAQGAIAYPVENHPNDSRVKIDESGKVQALTGRMGTGGGNVPLVMEPFCKSARGKFKGAAETWIPAKVANTLNTFDTGEARANELVVEPVYCLQGNGIDRADTAGCNGKGWKEDTCYTLNTIDRPAVAYGFDPSASRDVGQYFHEEKANPLVNGTCPGHKNGIVEKRQQGDGTVYTSSKGSFFTRADKDLASTLVATDYKDPQLVAYEVEEKPLGLGIQSSSGIGAIGENISPCLINGDNPGWQNGVMDTKPHYIVRRLTPTECARLQGFADRWGDIEEKKDFTDEEYRFWLDVRNTHAAINGKAVKDYTKKAMLTWYEKLKNDSAEYKMWGNGIALPPALYCMQGIREALDNQPSEEDLDDWMN